MASINDKQPIDEAVNPVLANVAGLKTFSKPKYHWLNPPNLIKMTETKSLIDLKCQVFVAGRDSWKLLSALHSGCFCAPVEPGTHAISLQELANCILLRCGRPAIHP
jgi:hypothetical protein